MTVGPATGPNKYRNDAPPPIASAVILGLFAANLILAVCAVKLSAGGLPVRTLFAFAALGVAALTWPRAIMDAITAYAQVLMLILGVAVLGAAVSFLNADPTNLVLRQIIEIHVQAAVGVVLGAVVVRCCGVGWAVTVFLLAVGISAAFAALQLVQMDFAWGVRKTIGSIAGDGPLTQLAYTRRERPMGLSFSPVHLGTQACLAFAAFFAWRLKQRQGNRAGLDYGVLAALVIMVVICFVSGNRSPILGAVIFAVIYLWVAAPRLAMLLLPLMVVAVPVGLGLLELLAQMGVRVARTDDGSAVGRAVLADYGWRLFLARPIGYGLNFDSTKFWPDFWEYLLYFGNPNQVKLNALHNYFVIMLNKYGVGLVLMLPLLFTKRTSVYYCVLPFVVYIMHIAFHNDGPFQADFLIWYVIPMFAPAVAMMEARRASSGRKPGGWRLQPRRSEPTPGT